MPNLELQIVQKAPEENVMSVQGEQSRVEATEMEDSLDSWHTVGQAISERKPGDVYFSTMDLTYAYGQLPLSQETSV